MPVAPNKDSNGYTVDSNIVAEAIADAEKSSSSPVYENERIKESENGKSDSSSSMEEDANSSDSGYKPKTPSTAERRKLFESKVTKDDSPENEDAGNFDRGNVNR